MFRRCHKIAMTEQVCTVQNVTTFFTSFVVLGFVVEDGGTASASALTPGLAVWRTAWMDR